MLELNAKQSALVLIDLQYGILALPTKPRPSEQVLANGKALAEKFRQAGATVVLVNVGWAMDLKDTPSGLVDQGLKLPEGGLTPQWMTLADGLAQPGDLRITKRHWGAFTGTELDLQLRRRGITDVVVGGIATNFGVESTVRHAWELGYNAITAEDVCTSLSPELHDTSIKLILPRISRVVSSQQLQFS